jgi:hypothetical protein
VTEQNNGGELERAEQALETIDVSKRESLRKIVLGTMFVAPVVVSFAIDGLMVSPAMAANGTHS